MRNKKKIIMIFLSGFLLMGIGAGISFAEFSSFQYGGEKLLKGEMTTITLNQEVPEDTTTLYLKLRDYWFKNIRVEKDDSMAAGQISVEILCNEAFIEPYLAASENPDEDQWYQMDVARREITQEMPSKEETKGQEPSHEEESSETEPGSVYFYLDGNYFGNDSEISDFFKIKDDILKNLKNRVIYSYSDDVEKGVVIRTPPQIHTVINY